MSVPRTVHSGRRRCIDDRASAVAPRAGVSAGAFDLGVFGSGADRLFSQTEARATAGSGLDLRRGPRSSRLGGEPHTSSGPTSNWFRPGGREPARTRHSPRGWVRSASCSGPPPSCPARRAERGASPLDARPASRRGRHSVGVVHRPCEIRWSREAQWDWSREVILPLAASRSLMRETTPARRAAHSSRCPSKRSAPAHRRGLLPQGSAPMAGTPRTAGGRPWCRPMTSERSPGIHGGETEEEV